MCAIRPGLGFVPAMLSAIMVLAIVITYIAATLNGHVEAFFPYISDTGVDLPERCIFSQFFNIAAFLALIVMYMRYKLIQGLIQNPSEVVTRLSKVNLLLAFLSCLGLSFVANFQETEFYHIEAVHLTGALLVFGFGVVYALSDTFISFRMYPTYNSLAICQIRLTIGVIGLVSLIATVTGAIVSRLQWGSSSSHDHDRLHWKPSDPGFAAHLVSTFGEWTMAAAFLCYYVTFIRDFQRFTLAIEPVLLVSHLDDPPSYESLRTARSPAPLRQPAQPDETSHLLV